MKTEFTKKAIRRSFERLSDQSWLVLQALSAMTDEAAYTNKETLSLYKKAHKAISDFTMHARECSENDE